MECFSKSMYISSDGQGSIKALESYRVTSKIVKICKRNLQLLCGGNRVTIAWEGNDRVDEPA